MIVFYHVPYKKANKYSIIFTILKTVANLLVHEVTQALLFTVDSARC